MRVDEIDIPAIIDENCSLAKQANPLYRGSTKALDYFIGTIRQDRLPRSSSRESVEIFNYFMETLGWPFRKSNTLSVTIHASQTENYGPVRHRIYPFNGAEYLGSTQSADFITIPMTIRVYWRPNNKFGTDIFAFIKDNAEELKELLGLIRTNNPSNLNGAAGEILVYGNQYVAVQEWISPML